MQVGPLCPRGGGGRFAPDAVGPRKGPHVDSNFLQFFLISRCAMPEISARIDYEPRAWARAVHEGIASHRFSVVVAHRGSGKTYLTAHSLVAEALSCKEPDGRFLFISPFLKQARDTAWIYLKSATRDVPQVQYQESLLQVRLPNGAWICLYGADDPDALRGMHPHGIVVDEVKDMKPEVWTEIILPMLHAHNAWVVFIGTAKGLNLLSKIYFEALKSSVFCSSTSVTPEKNCS